MKLTLKSSHLSITSFPSVELPPFTLITGVNGAGKTHLLEAIYKGHIETDVASNTETDMRFFNWNNMTPNNADGFAAQQIYDQRDTIIGSGRAALKEIREDLQDWALSHRLLEQIGAPISQLLRLEQSEFFQLLAAREPAENAWQELEKLTAPAIAKIKEQFRNNDKMRSAIDALEKKHGHGLLALRVSDFEDRQFGWGRVELFQQSFAQLFMGYFELQKLNKLRRWDEAEGLSPDPPPLSDEEFKERYGEEPWVFVNRVLTNANLDFEIDHPTDYSATVFQPQLTKKTSGIELQFSELSSGERILMSFAFCLYYSQETRQVLERPKLLLLDEVDAPLHPSMSRHVVNIIRESLVADHDVKVILATHSPSTVAVAPEDAVYVMKPEKPGLHKVTKRQAVSVLTSEIPTLSINFSGRRQVFVESQLDEERYEKLYRLLSPHIASERSLAFVAVGQRSTEGDRGSGCDNVKRIVNELVDFGNDSVFGLIDWDAKNEGNERVIVLAKKERYAIENCLLDPLLVAALGVHVDRNWMEKCGIAGGRTYTDFKSLGDDDCQDIIDAIERKVLGLKDGVDFGDRLTVNYFGGNSAEVSLDYIHMDGHQLEKLVKQNLPILNCYRKPGELLRRIIDPVLHDLIDLIPCHVKQAFQEILKAEP